MEANEPTLGGFTPSRPGHLKLEAEAVFPDGRRIFAFVPNVLVYDPINGGAAYTNDANTTALYHFNGDFTDATGNAPNLTVTPNQGASVTFAKAGWEATPNFNTDKGLVSKTREMS